MKGNLIGILIGMVVGFSLFFIISMVNERIMIDRVSKDIVNLYELMFPDIKFSIESIKKTGGMFKFLLKGSDNSYREVFVSSNGNYLTEAVIFVKESIQQIQKMKNFVDCLHSKNVRIFGMLQSNNTIINQATFLQLNILGRYSSKIYVSCDGEALNSCIAIGLKALPAVVINNTSYEGVILQAKDLANLSGCKLD
ncbi:MAG: hypothetical protein RMJ17_02870 [Candidatus Aenigmarchaeota archaeon]|nr:hypothetical protein [Candidatus Aenigmarchaeota archaeon]MDW8149509.1 hypothetical protein [Candidatus Aenigmarchaeota archaeon]